MFSRMATHLSAKRAAVALALLAALRDRLRGERSGASSGDPAARGAEPPSACGATVLETLSQVPQRVYDEGVSSERTEIAMRLIKGSRALREAVERDDPRRRPRRPQQRCSPAGT